MPQSIQRSSPSRQEKFEFTYPLLAQTVKAFDAHLKSRRAQNAGLIFDRFAPDSINDSKGEAKKKGFEQTIQAEDGNNKELQWLLKALNARWDHVARQAQVRDEELIALKTDWRFLTGLGRKGPLEAGFTFDRYGFPILPGSSVKGIARAYATLVEQKTEADEDFAAIFGRAPKQGESENVAQSGGAIFLDAIPTFVPKLELDIMNPHFPDYYGDKNNRMAPTDWQSPKPVFFLTVAPNTEFRFAVGWRGSPDETLQKQAREWLVKGLQELGAGAKTSAGYGYFKDGDDKVKETPSIEDAQASQPVARVEKAESARPSTRHTATGKIAYESSKAYVKIEGQRHRRVKWNELGMRELKGGTVVEIEYLEFDDGTYKVVRVTQKRG